MKESREEFRSVVIKKTLGVNGGMGVRVIDLGLEEQPETWIRFKKGCLYILGDDGAWHEIDEEHALAFWEAKQVKDAYISGLAG